MSISALSKQQRKTLIIRELRKKLSNIDVYFCITEGQKPWINSLNEHSMFMLFL